MQEPFLPQERSRLLVQLDINDAIEIGVNHCLEPLRTQLLERRNVAEPGVVNDDVEAPKRIKRYLHGVSRAFIRQVKRNRADAIAEFIYQVIQSSWVARCGDQSIARFEHCLRNVPAKPLALPVTNHTLPINTSICCLVNRLFELCPPTGRVAYNGDTIDKAVQNVLAVS